MKHLAALGMLITTAALALHAQSTADFTAEENKDGTMRIVKYLGKDEKAVVPEKIDGKWVRVIGEYAFNRDNNVSVETVILPRSVTEIQRNAFPSTLLSLSIGPSVRLEEYTGLDKTGNVAVKTLGALGKVWGDFTGNQNVQTKSGEAMTNGKPDDSSVGWGFEYFYKNNNRKAGVYYREKDTTAWSYKEK